MEVINPIFKDLTKKNLLKRCLHRKTQNPNESFNSIISHRLPKIVFVELQIPKLGVTDSVTCFNEGSISVTNFLQWLCINPGKFVTEGFKEINKQRKNSRQRDPCRKQKRELEEKEKKREKNSESEKEMRRQWICWLLPSRILIWNDVHSYLLMRFTKIKFFLYLGTVLWQTK